MSPRSPRATSHAPQESDHNQAPQWSATSDLATRIRSRIEQRLGDRIRDLTVSVEDHRVELGGQCSTYYSKQLAQHAALGVLEDELLSNIIQVGVSN